MVGGGGGGGLVGDITGAPVASYKRSRMPLKIRIGL